MCAGEAFQWFTAHLLARLPEFRAIYNEAVREYRRVHHVRSLSHPVPELAEEGPWLEAPLWVWTADEPRRRRLFARAAGGEIVALRPAIVGGPAAASGRWACRPRAFLADSVPEVKVAIAHGQMAAGELEDIMNAFYDGRYDVLLSTTIVESGLDMPTANTLIVHRADMFGLGSSTRSAGGSAAPSRAPTRFSRCRPTGR